MIWLQGRINVFLLMMIFLSNIAFAGVIREFLCNKCGFKSSPVYEGSGMLGIENTTIYCNKCKKFQAIPTKIVMDREDNKDFNIVEPIGKGEFLGEERLVYPCPVCGLESFAYNGPLCPICGEGLLQAQVRGMWD